MFCYTSVVVLPFFMTKTPSQRLKFLPCLEYTPPQRSISVTFAFIHVCCCWHTSALEPQFEQKKEEMYEKTTKNTFNIQQQHLNFSAVQKMKLFKLVLTFLGHLGAVETSCETLTHMLLNKYILSLFLVSTHF